MRVKIDEFWPLFLSRTTYLGSHFDTLNVFFERCLFKARISSTQKSCNNNNNNNRLRSHHTVVVFVVVVVPLEMEEKDNR